MTVPPTPQSIIDVIESKATKDNSAAVGNSVLSWCISSWKPVAAELLSTSILLLVGCMSCIPIDELPYQNPMYPAITFGFVVSFNIQIFGHLSGAHMNPSVSLAAMIWGSLSIPLGIAYILAQVAGAVLGYGILVAVAPINLATDGICVNLPHDGLNVFQILGIEVALTSVLNFLNCSVWDPVNKNRTDSIPLKFGLAIAGLSLAGGPLTGASMNPARSLGPVVWTGVWSMHWVYWVGPLIGGILPTVIYKFIWLKKEYVKEEQISHN